MQNFILVYIAIAMTMIRLNASTYDAIVSKDDSGDYSTIQSAVDNAPSGRTSPWKIYIKSGTYEEQVIIPEEKSFIHLVGENKNNTTLHLRLNVGAKPNPEKIKDEPFWASSIHNPESQVYNYEGAVLNIKAQDFHAENLSIINDFGVDSQSGPMALAIKIHTDRVSFDNCIVRSYQDTWQTSGHDSHRLYVRNSFIEGAVDYIFGGGDALFENCTLYNVRSGSIIVAPCHKTAKFGYVFRNCVVDGNEAATDGKQKLGRPWHNAPIAVYIHTTMLIPIAPEGWTNMGTIPALFAEYDSRDADGNVLDLSQRKTEYEGRGEKAGTGSCRVSITKEEADELTYERIIKSKDGWDPHMWMKEER